MAEEIRSLNGYLLKDEQARGDVLALGARVTALESGSGSAGGGSVEVDATLTQAGKAADAAATGTRIGAVETAQASTSADVTQINSRLTALAGRVTAVESGAITVDATLTQSGKAADAKAAGDRIAAVEAQVGAIAPGLTASEKALLLKLFESAAYADGGIKASYEALKALWDGGSTPDVVPVASVTLSSNTLTLAVDATETLTATVYPESATDKNVVWSASPSGIVTVTNGVVKGLSAGQCTVTATCGGKQAFCTVTVAASTLLYSLPAETTLVSAQSQYIDTGLKLFSKAAAESPKYTILMEMALTRGIAYSDSVSPCLMHCYDEAGDKMGLNVAVWGNGRVMASYCGTSAELSGTPNWMYTAHRFAIQIDGQKFRLGWPDQIGAWQTGVNALTDYDGTLLIGAGRTSAGGIARYLDGTYARFEVHSRLMSDNELSMFLQDKEAVDATAIALSPATLELEVGRSKAVTAALTPENATSEITWSVSPDGIASIADGTVKGLAVGNCTIMATANGHSATCAVTVKAASGAQELVISTTTKTKEQTVWSNSAPLLKSYYVPITATQDFKLKKLEFVLRLTGATALSVELYNKTDGQTVEAVTLAATEGDYNVVAEYSNAQCKAGKEYQIWLNSGDNKVMNYPVMPGGIEATNDYFTTTGTAYQYNNTGIRFMGDVTIEG